jgi:hypothetical protein
MKLANIDTHHIARNDNMSPLEIKTPKRAVLPPCAGHSCCRMSCSEVAEMLSENTRFYEDTP